MKLEAIPAPIRIQPGKTAESPKKTSTAPSAATPIANPARFFIWDRITVVACVGTRLIGDATTLCKSGGGPGSCTPLIIASNPATSTEVGSIVIFEMLLKATNPGLCVSIRHHG